jgi:hypothetical protein
MNSATGCATPCGPALDSLDAALESHDREGLRDRAWGSTEDNKDHAGRQASAETPEDDAAKRDGLELGVSGAIVGSRGPQPCSQQQR